MGKTLAQIAQQLQDANKKVQLIYAFNGSGKTRLSRAFKDLIAPKNSEDHNGGEIAPPRNKILYYNAFTEDLFYWDNDLDSDVEPKLKVQPNTFTDWLITLLQELGEDGNIASNFQRYTSSNINPVFNQRYTKKIRNFDEQEVDLVVPAFSEISFQVPINRPVVAAQIDSGASVVDAPIQGQYQIIKISKGEESNFIWSVAYTLLEQAVLIRNEANIANRVTDKFNNLEYVFIDDPVSSLDDGHLIELAVDLAGLIKKSAYVEGKGLKFVITTHSPLFYNVLHNELNNDLKKRNQDGTSSWIYKRGQSEKYRLEKKADGNFDLITSNDHPFSYHLFLLAELRSAIKDGQIKKYHFNFLRNILEKTATFLGYLRWEDLLQTTSDGVPDPFANRILNLSSHSAHSGEEVAEIEESDKERLAQLVSFLGETYRFKKQEAENF